MFYNLSFTVDTYRKLPPDESPSGGEYQ